MATKRPEITSRLAARLKEERTAKGLSLDAFSKLSGVSRSMLSQIERGESSPTVASLWNLTRALNIDFAGLLDEESASTDPIQEILRADQTPEIHNSDAKCRIKILSRPSDVNQTEVYDISFERGAALISEPHKTGCVEHLTVLEGSLSVTSGTRKTIADTGDTIRYQADLPHEIRAEGTARALLLVVFS